MKYKFNFAIAGIKEETPVVCGLRTLFEIEWIFAILAIYIIIYNVAKILLIPFWGKLNGGTIRKVNGGGRNLVVFPLNQSFKHYIHWNSRILPLIHILSLLNPNQFKRFSKVHASFDSFGLE